MSALQAVTDRIEGATGLDRVAGWVREQAHGLLVDDDRLDALLGGDWLGHPVHPLAAQLPLGAWLSATALDVTGGDRHARAVDALTLLGIVTALPTALTGAHDLATTRGSALRVAFVHAGTMDATLALFVAAHLARRRGRRPTARKLALAGVAVAGAGGWLGGHLVYRLGVGVR